MSHSLLETSESPPGPLASSPLVDPSLSSESEMTSNGLPNTISTALRGVAKSEEGYRTYTPYLRMTQRFLGEKPTFYPILSLSPTAIRTHVGLFARFFHAPFVDMRLPGLLSPEHRRLAFLTASSKFDCTYFTAHACAFGNMFHGSIVEQVERGRISPHRISLDPSDPALTLAESTIIAFVSRPFRAEENNLNTPNLSQLAQSLEREIGVHPTEILKAVTSFTGALNVIMDIQGVELEAKVQAFSCSVLEGPEGPWYPSDHPRNKKASNQFSGPISEMYGLRGMVYNIRGLLETMPSAMSGMAYELGTLYGGLPFMPRKLNEFVEQRLGESDAVFFKNVSGIELKRAFCLGLRENLIVDESAIDSHEWTLHHRISFLYTFSTVTESHTLREVAVALMAGTRTCTSTASRQELERFVAVADEELEETVNEGRRLVVASSTRTENISPQLVGGLVVSCSPGAIIELASLMSFFELWRRMQLLFTLEE